MSNLPDRLNVVVTTPGVGVMFTNVNTELFPFFVDGKVKSGASLGKDPPPPKLDVLIVIYNLQSDTPSDVSLSGMLKSPSNVMLVSVPPE